MRVWFQMEELSHGEVLPGGPDCFGRLSKRRLVWYYGSIDLNMSIWQGKTNWIFIVVFVLIAAAVAGGLMIYMDKSSMQSNEILAPVKQQQASLPEASETEGMASNEIPGKNKYDKIEHVASLSDGTAVYIAQREGQNYVVKGEQEQLAYTKLDSAWKKNGHVVYRFFDKDRTTIFLDGEELDRNRSVWVIEVSADGKHVLYGNYGSGKNDGYFVHDGIEYRYDKVGGFTLDEGGNFAFAAYDKKLGKEFLVVNGKEDKSNLCGAISAVQFDPKGGIAYVCADALPETSVANWSKFSLSPSNPNKLYKYSFFWNHKLIYTVSTALNENLSAWSDINFPSNVFNKFVFNEDNTSIAFQYLREDWSKDSFKAPDSFEVITVVDGVERYRSNELDRIIQGFDGKGGLTFAGYYLGDNPANYIK